MIKGAAGVRYGPDAVGGVVLVDPPELPTEQGVTGAVQTVFVSNGRRGIVAARVDDAFSDAFAARVEGNFSRGASLLTPTYVLGNTASREWNAGVRLGWHQGLTKIEAAYSHYDFLGGICYCVEHHSWDEFLAQLDDDAPVGSEDWRSTYTIDCPKQEVAHDQVLGRFVRATDAGAVFRVTYAFQRNHREEFDIVRENVTGSQYDFLLRTHTLDAEAGHAPIDLGHDATLAGSVALTGTFQENVYFGLPLIPNYRGASGGVAGTERLEAQHTAVELGARYDHLSRTAYLLPSHYETAVARDTLQEIDCTHTETAAKCPTAYDAATVSVGGLWHVVPDHVEARLDLSSASRFPNADELYMNGAAPTAPVYAIGDPDLGVETTWGSSPTLGLRLPWLDAQVSAYANFTDDYVYYAPEVGEDGELAYDVTIRGAYPRYTFRPIDALFYGFDGGATLGPNAPVSLIVLGSLVRAQDVATGSGLVLTPSDRVEASVRYTPRLRAIDDGFVELSSLYVAEQTHVDVSQDFAPPPDAYVLFGAGMGASFALGRDRLEVGIEATNLLNERYREYTSLLRYFADEPGRDVRVRAGLHF